jgi:hypothetical protein
MRIRIIGCDLHARQQTLAMLDNTTGEVLEVTLQHEGDKARRSCGSFEGNQIAGKRPSTSICRINCASRRSFFCFRGAAARRAGLSASPPIFII